MTQHFEQLTPAYQDRIASLIPNRLSWRLLLVRDALGYWSFSLPEYETYDELLCGGTEKAIDWHYENLTRIKPVPGSRMVVNLYNGDKMTAGSFHTVLEYVRPDYVIDDSNYYIDVESLIVCWFCPYLLALLKSAPQTIYLHFEPVCSLKTGTSMLADQGKPCHNNIVLEEPHATQDFDLY